MVNITKYYVCAKSFQLCLTLCNPVDCSPPGSSVHGILQARVLEWVAMPSSRGSSQPRDQTHIFMSPALAGGFFTTSTTWESPLIIREMQIKTRMRYHVTPLRTAIIKRVTNNKCWSGCREERPLLYCCWKSKLIQPLWGTVWRLLKKLKIE